MKQNRVDSVQMMTKMALCVALCCIAAYISIPLPFTAAMITALTLAMNLTAFILGPRETFIVLLHTRFSDVSACPSLSAARQA